MKILALCPFLMLNVICFSQRNKKLIEKTTERKHQQATTSTRSNNNPASNATLSTATDLVDDLEIITLFFDFFCYTLEANIAHAKEKVKDSVYYAIKLESNFSLGTAGKNYELTNWRTEVQIGTYSIDYRRFSTVEYLDGAYTPFRTDDIQFLELNLLNTRQIRLQAGYGITTVHNQNLALSEFTLGIRYYVNPTLYLEVEYRRAAEFDDNTIFRREFNFSAKYRPFEHFNFLQVNIAAYTATYFEAENFIGIHGGVGINLDGLLKNKPTLSRDHP